MRLGATPRLAPLAPSLSTLDAMAGSVDEQAGRFDAGPDDEGHDDGEDVSAGVWCESGSARAVIAAAIAAAVDQLRVELPRARSGLDPEGVHQARVATRRLRSDLRTFAPLLDDAWLARTRAELRWLADALGAVRDNDVLRARLASAARDAGVAPHDVAPLDARLAEEGRLARQRLDAVLDDERARSLVAVLTAAASDPPTTPAALGRAERRLVPLVRRPWRKLVRSVDALGREPEVDELHRVRLLGKRARYAAEAVAPVFGKDARRFASAVQDVQEVLGELNDAEVAVAWLTDVGPDLEPAGAFVAGRLTQHLRNVADDHHHGWERSFRRARRRSGWLR